ncbi:unnamed protein product [Paramecium octaurelia]|uniref:Transmembrane protein n=1 Tax=Paramecium octaurelia TaxID=43137 RepID=A0A8S1T973_PAROT|nr:unnamed protein product [Paramecium octaurelia]
MKKKNLIRELVKLALDRAEWVQQNDLDQILIQYQAVIFGFQNQRFFYVVNLEINQGIHIIDNLPIPIIPKLSRKTKFMLKQLRQIQLIETLQKQLLFIEYILYIYLCAKILEQGYSMLNGYSVFNEMIRFQNLYINKITIFCATILIMLLYILIRVSFYTNFNQNQIQIVVSHIKI